MKVLAPMSAAMRRRSPCVVAPMVATQSSPSPRRAGRGAARVVLLLARGRRLVVLGDLDLVVARRCWCLGEGRPAEQKQHHDRFAHQKAAPISKQTPWWLSSRLLCKPSWIVGS